MMSSSSVLQRVSDARTYLTAKVPFLGFMALRLRPRVAVPEDGVPTAGVGQDGTLVLNEEFIATLTEPQFRGLIAHEVLHPAMHFFERMASKQLRPWNAAHDFKINQVIQGFIDSGRSGNIELPPGGLLDNKYNEMSAEEIYESFPKVSQPGNGGKGGKGSKGQGPPQPGGGGGTPQDPGEDNPLGGDCRPDLSSTAQGKAAGRGDSSAQERLAREWKQALVAAAQVHEQQKGRGSLPGNLRIFIDELLDPKMHWTDVLSRYLGEHAGKPDLTYMRPSRRSAAAGEILIGRRRRTFPDVTVFWDTSGSQTGEEKNILPEVNSMCEDLDLSIRVVIIDSAIHADLENVTDAVDVIQALAGGGGSDFRPAFDLLDEERNTSVVIAFTDGYIGVPEVMPDTLKGVIWVLTQRGCDPTHGKWGEVLRLDDEKNGGWE
jgi:predicted metal-dependent peptidase